MQQDTAGNPIEAEREELEAVAAILVRSPRLANLLRYIGEKYLSGESDHLSEYNIATEVFGRSKTVFDSGEDAIARVEAHRLRKRLKEYYENGGKDRPIHVSIPPGTYVPVFTRRTAILSQEPVPNIESRNQSENPASPQNYSSLFEVAAHDSHASKESTRPHRPIGNGRPGPEVAEHTGPRFPSGKRPLWHYALGVLGLSLAVFGIYLAAHHGASGTPEATNTLGQQTPELVAGSSATTPQITPATVVGALPVRIMAGYEGKPQTDSAGAVWGTDQYFHGGGSWRRGASQVYRTSDPLIFDHWRTGDFQYDIPLKPGSYELHLYFVTSEASGVTSFTIGINGASVLPGFEVNTDALGADIADERVFRDVSPAKDGYLHISFTSERGAPALSALEVLPGIPHKQLPIRLVTQPNSFTDHDGQFWHPDTYFMNGHQSTLRQMISGTPDPDVFAAERYGHFTYAIPVDTRGRYTLILHFAEFYFGQQDSGGGSGNRLFRVLCNGNTLLDNFDVYKEAGSLHAITRTFSHIKPSAQGKLNITFEPISNNATVSGIEVIDESQ